MRRVALVPMVVVLLASCSRTAGPAPSPSPPSPSAVATSTATPSPSPAAELQLPADAPTTFDQALAPSDVPASSLVPPGASVTASWTMSPPADPLALIGLAWARGSDPFSAQRGFVIWERFEGQTPAWRAVYAFTDRPARGILGIQLSPGDLTGDGIDDVLTFEDAGGSGGCGMWRVVTASAGAADQIYRRPTCDTQIVNAGGALHVQEAVYQPGDAHCCPSSYLLTTLRWNGSRWKVAESRTSPGPSANG